jgi:hypothetical protein
VDDRFDRRAMLECLASYGCLSQFINENTVVQRVYFVLVLITTPFLFH